MDAIEPAPDEPVETRERATASPPQPVPERPFFPHPELMSIALETGQIGIWSWDIASNRITWSTNVEEIHGLPGGRFDGALSDFENEIHPEDRPGVVAAIQETLQTHKPHRVQYACSRGRGR
jgi:PAS domain-containing protein